MGSRAEITAKWGTVKDDTGRLLDEVVTVTGWSQDNAHCRLAAAARPLG